MRVNLSIQKAIEVIRNLNYFSFCDERNIINIDSYFKSLIFIINQFYSQEFIHNSAELEDKDITLNRNHSAVHKSSISKSLSVSSHVSLDKDEIVKDQN